MFRLGSPKRVKPERLETAVEALRGAMGRLRRRVVPPNGEGYSWDEWKSALIAIGRTDLAREWQKRYVNLAEHSVDDCSDCYTERIRCEDSGTEGHSVDDCSDCETYKVRCEYAGSNIQGIPFEEIVPAGFYGIDVKQKRDGRLNIHAHVLADIPWLPQEALAALWGEIHSAPVVDIRRVDGRNQKDMEKAAMEVVGYAAKPPEFLDEEQEAAYLTALKRSKLVQPFGDLHSNTP